MNPDTSVVSLAVEVARRGGVLIAYQLSDWRSRNPSKSWSQAYFEVAGVLQRRHFHMACGRVNRPAEVRSHCTAGQISW